MWTASTDRGQEEVEPQADHRMYEAGDIIGRI